MGWISMYKFVNRIFSYELIKYIKNNFWTFKDCLLRLRNYEAELRRKKDERLNEFEESSNLWKFVFFFTFWSSPFLSTFDLWEELEELFLKKKIFFWFFVYFFLFILFSPITMSRIVGFYFLLLCDWLY